MQFAPGVNGYGMAAIAMGIERKYLECCVWMLQLYTLDGFKDCQVSSNMIGMLVEPFWTQCNYSCDVFRK